MNGTLLWSLCFVLCMGLVLSDGAVEAGNKGAEGATVEKMKADEKIVVSQPEGSAVSLGFVHAFVASLSVIIVSELGDKTFFIAAIMAMRHARSTVLSGAIAALALMTVMSTTLGYAVTVIPRIYTYYGSSLLFALFGIKMLRDGYKMSADEGQEELEEVTAELKRKEAELGEGTDVEAGSSTTSTSLKWSRILRLVSPVWVQTFTLTFLAEWGDRSQMATIILGAREDPIGVTLGGTFGHFLCTGLAVLGGRLIAQRISVKTVTLIGGVVFLIFAATAYFIGP